VLDDRGMAGADNQVQRAFGFFPDREPDRFGRAIAGMRGTDDFVSAGDVSRLDKTKAPKCGATDGGHQIADHARLAAARAFRRTRRGLTRSTWALGRLFDFRTLWITFHHAASHAIAA